MTKEVKSFSFEFEAKESDDGAMTIKGYGSTFGNVDDGGDVVLPGAFKQSLAKRMPKMFWQHDPRQLPGVWDVAQEDSKGLYLEGRFLKTTLGRDVYEQAKEGVIDRMSIGYGVKQSSLSADKKVRELKELALYEVSLVTFPMNDEARILAVKTLPQTIRELEQLLRDAGYSKEKAKEIASIGFKEQADDLRDAADAALVESLTKLTNQLKGSHNGTHRNQKND